jgi:chemotaxis protein MotB
MAIRRRRSSEEGMGGAAWPGYVDALSTLLMVIIFVLLVFVLAQAFLSVALTGRDRALDRVNRQMAQLTDMLSLERGRTAELRLSMAQINRDLQAATTARDTLAQQLTALRAEQAKTLADRDSLRTERDTLAAKLADSTLQLQSLQSRADQLQKQAADAASQNDSAAADAATTAAQLADTQRQLAEAQKRADANAKLAQTAAEQLAARSKSLEETGKTLTATQAQLEEQGKKLAMLQLAQAQAQKDLDAAQQQIAEMKRQAAEMDKTVTVDRATIEAKLSEMAKMAEQMRALTALRDELERQAQDAAARAVTEQQRREAVAAQLADEKKLGDSARAQIALLNQQVEQLKLQLAQIGKALDISEASGKDKDAQIANLGSRLNAALAQKVEELQKYRSEFFGKLRQVLAGRPGIQVVGDRFVFQSEVLFPSGSADLSASGAEQIFRLADTINALAKEIPPEVHWLLRVDGQADKNPVQGGKFTSNWELSAQRAINVVKLLIVAGVPPDRLAATAFGDTEPLDPADTPEAYAKNRRIELRLTSR